jgi:hypothetical protein
MLVDKLREPEHSAYLSMSIEKRHLALDLPWEKIVVGVQYCDIFAGRAVDRIVHGDARPLVPLECVEPDARICEASDYVRCAIDGTIISDDKL